MEDNNKKIDEEEWNKNGSDEENKDISEENTDNNTPDGNAEEGENGSEDDIEGSENMAENETSSEESEEETDEQIGSDKKGFFGKDKKEKKKDKKDLLIEELTDKYKRTFAEFDNFRKRSEKEKSSMYEIGAKDIIEKILPVVDNFERGFSAISEEEKATPFAEGMDKIYKQLLKTLEDAGVKEIEAEGKEFDPNLHNAVMHIEDDSLSENVVAEVLQKGYTYRDTVVRHSMVKVAN